MFVRKAASAALFLTDRAPWRRWQTLHHIQSFFLPVVKLPQEKASCNSIQQGIIATIINQLISLLACSGISQPSVMDFGINPE